MGMIFFFFIKHLPNSILQKMCLYKFYLYKQFFFKFKLSVSFENVPFMQYTKNILKLPCSQQE